MRQYSHEGACLNSPSLQECRREDSTSPSYSGRDLPDPESSPSFSTTWWQSPTDLIRVVGKNKNNIRSRIRSSEENKMEEVSLAIAHTASDRHGFSCLVRQATFPEFTSPHVQILFHQLDATPGTSSKSFAGGARAATTEHEQRQMQVLYLSGHFGHLYDPMHVIETEFGDWKLHLHGVLSYHKAYFPHLQSGDAELVEMLGQIHKTKAKLHEDWETLQAWFGAWLERTFPTSSAAGESSPLERTRSRTSRSINLDVVLCGHPVLWCKLFADYPASEISVVASYDNPFHFLVPQGQIEQWRHELRDLIRRRNYFFVSYTAYASIQLHYIADAGIVPWQAVMALPLGEHYAKKMAKEVDEHQKDREVVLVHPGSTRLSVARRSGQGEHFQFSRNLKIIELDSTGGNWHGPSIMLRKMIEESVPGSRVACAEIAVSCVEDPDWQEFRTNAVELLGAAATNKEVPASGPQAKRFRKMMAQTLFFDFVILWPYDITNMKLSEYYALRLPIFVHRELWRYTRRGSHALGPGGVDPRPEVNARLEDRVANCKREREASLELRISSSDELFGKEDSRKSSCTDAALFDISLTGTDVVASAFADINEKNNVSETLEGTSAFPYAFTPFEWQGRFRMDPYAGWFYARIAEFALRPHLQYYRSVRELAEVAFVLAEEKKRTGRIAPLERIREQMETWYRDAAANTKSFWKKLFTAAERNLD
ncbi:unnamed protein product [Amoebophrya sp. A120]|nr:unnamed protein product [Amoebophrya sp. A120]|eukprot:GSA120T00003600001.1